MQQENINENVNIRHSLRTVAFTEEENREIKQARQSLGVDRPNFYHRAVIEFARSINRKEKENGK